MVEFCAIELGMAW